MDFSNRYGPWALITGASEGTGREFARQIAAKGLPSVLVARREGPLKDLAAEIRAESGVECVTATVDLAAPDAGAQLVAAAGGREIGLFVANAGADPNGSNFLDREVGAWRDLTQRNVMNVLEACHHFGGLMRARGRGGLLIVGSGACYGGASHLTTYSATKAFQLCFAEGLWAELRPFGVDVLYLVMSTTDTPALRALLAEKGQPVPPGTASAADVAAEGLARLPHGPVRNWGQDDDASGFGGASASQRRARIEMIDEMSKAIFG
jgi:short-subunit dehydrogenase